MTTIPDRLPVTSMDRILGCLDAMGPMILQMELTFAHQLDEERLRKALDLSLDAEPVLGCRWVDDQGKPYWERVPREERDLLKVIASQDEYDAALLEVLDIRKIHQVQAVLWPRSEGDKLLLRVSHFPADAGGMKEAIGVLSSIYNRLDKEPDYTPEPNLKGSRSYWQVLKRVPLWAWPSIHFNQIRTLLSISIPANTHALETTGEERVRPGFSKRHFSKDRIASLSEYGHGHGATLNDLFITAFFRAIFNAVEWDGKAHFRVCTTVDLRRHYIPGGRAEGITNLSGFEYYRLGTDLGNAFEDTLDKVVTRTRKRKRRWMGLNDYVGFIPYYSMLPFKTQVGIFRKVMELGKKKGSVSNVLTNTGPIELETVNFGGPALDAQMLTPLIDSPFFGVGLSGYNGTLGLGCGYYNAEENRPLIERFLDLVEQEFPA